MKAAWILSLLASAASAQAQQPGSFAVPLHEDRGWQVLQYSGLPPHRVRFAAAGLQMSVDGSAMPLIYPLPAPVRAVAIRARGRIEGALRLPAGLQGEPKHDDYVLRIGLVEPGARRLNFVQRQLAPAWVRTLFALAPEKGGISQIHFFNLGADSAHLGRRRQHPLSELIVETVVALPRADGRFDFTHALETPLDAMAVWLSSDGDDTGSTFGVFVEEIELRGR